MLKGCMRGLICVGMLMGTATSWAADAPASRPAGRGIDVAGRIEATRKLFRDLLPTDDQLKKIDDVLNDAKGKLEKFGEELSPQERIAQMRVVMEGVRAQVEPLLSEEQRAKLQEKLAALQTPAGMLTAMVVDRVKAAGEKLELNDEQKAKFKSLIEDLKKKLEDFKPDEGDRQAIQAKAQELRQTISERLQTILTPEQLNKFRELMGRGAAGPATLPSSGKAG